MEHNASTAVPGTTRCLDDDNGNSLAGHECVKLQVSSNFDGEPMFYSGQLLYLFKNESHDKASTRKGSQTRARVISGRKANQDGNSAAICSKIFSALSVADFQFNFPKTQTSTSVNTTTITTATTVAANGTSTCTTNSAASMNAPAIKTTTSKTKPTSPSFSLQTSVSASCSNLKSPFGETSASLPSLGITNIPTATTTEIFGATAQVTKSSSSTIKAKTSEKCSNAEVTSNITFSTPTGSTTAPTKITKSTVQSATSSNHVLSFKKSSTNWNPSSTTALDGSSFASVLPVQHKVKVTTGITNRDKNGYPSVEASKYPISPSHENHLDKENEVKKGRRKIKKSKYKGKTDVSISEDCGYTVRKRESHKDEITSTTLQEELLKAQLHCFQIQHSLYKTLVAKLRNMERQSMLQPPGELSNDAKANELQSLLLPLEALLRCSDIQLGLHHGLSVAISEDTDIPQCDEENSFNKENINSTFDKDELLIESRSLMNNTKFAKSLVCFHLFNPYASDLRYACGDDLISSPSFSVPHGEGKLVSLGENLIYEGQWKKGKRWGKGKAFIFSGIELSASKNQYGMYEGNWWNNMRHGHGRLVFSSCAVYEGEWQYDLMSGVGAMHFPDGSVLEGVWDEGEPNGCSMFTWPNGTVEYREYQNGQVLRVLKSPEDTKKISSLNEVMREYSVLRLKYQMIEEDKVKLIQSESRLKEQKLQAEYYRDNLNQANREKVKKLREEFARLLKKHKKSLVQKHQVDLQKMNESHDRKIKDLEDKIHKVEVELESKKSDLLCQICFDRDRDCILMPCSHLLYCRGCIEKLLNNNGKPARCPACRGPINSQINCNISL